LDGRLHVIANGTSESDEPGNTVPGSSNNSGAQFVSVTTLRAPDNAMHSYEEAQKALAQSKLETAENKLRKAVVIYPHFAVAWALLGSIHEKESRLDQAQSDYFAALLADRQLVGPYYRLAEIAFADKRWADVIRITDELINTGSYGSSLAYFYNAAANFNIGNTIAAEKHARKFQSIDEGRAYPQIFILLGDILKKEGRYAEAAQQLKYFLSVVHSQVYSEQIQKEIEDLEELADSSQPARVSQPEAPAH